MFLMVVVTFNVVMIMMIIDYGFDGYYMEYRGGYADPYYDEYFYQDYCYDLPRAPLRATKASVGL